MDGGGENPNRDFYGFRTEVQNNILSFCLLLQGLIRELQIFTR